MCIIEAKPWLTCILIVFLESQRQHVRATIPFFSPQAPLRDTGTLSGGVVYDIWERQS